MEAGSREQLPSKAANLFAPYVQRKGMKMTESKDIPQPQAIGAFNVLSSQATKPQEYYDRIKQKFAEERDLRLKYRPEGTAQYTSDLTGALAKYEIDPYRGEITPREPVPTT